MTITPSSVFIYICGILAIGGAVGAVSARNPIRGAMGLLVLILSIAVLFLSLHAEFLAFIQLIVYAGAIIVLFLFVMMLLGPSANPPSDNRAIISRIIGASVFFAAGGGALFVMVRATRKAIVVPPASSDFGGVNSFGQALFQDAVVPFELSSALLMVAVIGAIAVAKGKQPERPVAVISSTPSIKDASQPAE